MLSYKTLVDYILVLYIVGCRSCLNVDDCKPDKLNDMYVHLNVHGVDTLLTLTM